MKLTSIERKKFDEFEHFEYRRGSTDGQISKEREFPATYAYSAGYDSGTKLRIRLTQ